MIYPVIFTGCRVDHSQAVIPQGKAPVGGTAQLVSAGARTGLAYRIARSTHGITPGQSWWWMILIGARLI